MLLWDIGQVKCWIVAVWYCLFLFRNPYKYFDIYSGCIACSMKERTRISTAALLRNLTVCQQAPLFTIRLGKCRVCAKHATCLFRDDSRGNLQCGAVCLPVCNHLSSSPMTQPRHCRLVDQPARWKSNAIATLRHHRNRLGPHVACFSDGFSLGKQLPRSRHYRALP
jgi:hypothetical protein